MKKRVAIMVNCLRFGGAERIMADLSLYLEKNGYDVYLLLMDDKDIAYPHGGKAYKISFWAVESSPLSALITVQHLILTSYYKRKLKIDITISAMEFLNVVNLLTGRGDKIIPTIHNYKLQTESEPTLKNRLVEWIFSKKVKKAYRVVTVAKAIREKALSLYNIPEDKIVSVYNAFDIEDIREKAALPPSPEIQDFINDKTFVSVSRLAEQKSVHKIIVAFSQVIKKHSGARLILVGDGPLRGRLEELLAELNIEKNVYITGFSQNPHSITARARAFVLCSHYEGFGNVIVEAMAAGAVVIAADCMCGPREIIAPGTNGPACGAQLCEYGILTTPHNGEWSSVVDKSAADLAQAMELVLQDDKVYEQYKKKSQIRAEDFAISACYAQWLDIIEGDHSYEKKLH